MSEARTELAARWALPLGAGLSVLLLALGGPILRFVGAGLTVFLLPAVLAPLRERLPRIPERHRHHLPGAALVLLWLVLLGELLLGHPPASRDHAIHYFQTHLLVDELIPRGHLSGWSHHYNNGYPLGESYPWFGYAWMGALHLGTGRLVSLRTSYAFGIAALWAVSTWGVWRLSLRILERDEPNVAARWAAAVAAALWLIDPGASREGGWNYLMFHGVWPQQLSTGLWVASLSLTWDAMRRPKIRTMGLAALCIGGSILAHPFGMLTTAVSAIVWPFVWLLVPPAGEDGARPRWWIAYGAVHAVGSTIAVSFVRGFLGAADTMDRSPVFGEPLGDLSAELLAGELFRDHRTLAGALVLFGLVVVVRARRSKPRPAQPANVPLAWAAAAMLVVLLVAASQEALSVFRLDLLVSGFKNLQFPRYAIAQKPLAAALAGVGVFALVKLATRDKEASPQRHALGMPRLAACLLLAPLALSVVSESSRLVRAPVGRLHTLESSHHRQTDEALAALLEQEVGEDDSVLFLRGKLGGGTFVLMALADAKIPVLIDSHVAAINYGIQLRSVAPGTLRGLGVDYVVYYDPTDLALAQHEPDLKRVLEPVGAAGPYRLARLPEPRDDVPFRGASAVSWGPERIELEVDRDAGRLEIPLAPYPRWKATLDGAPLELGGTPVLPGVRGTKIERRDDERFEPGQRVVLTYERLGGPLRFVSLGALALALAGLAFGTVLGPTTRQALPTRLTLGVTVGTIAVVSLLAWRRQEAQLEITWNEIYEEQVGTNYVDGAEDLGLARDLASKGGISVETEARTECDGMLGKDARANCVGANELPHLSITYREPYVYRCLSVTLPPHTEMRVHLDIEGDEVAAGFVDFSARRTGREMTVKFPTRPAPDRFRRTKQRSFQLSADNPSFELSNVSERSQTACIAASAARP